MSDVLARIPARTLKAPTNARGSRPSAAPVVAEGKRIDDGNYNFDDFDRAVYRQQLRALSPGMIVVLTKHAEGKQPVVVGTLKQKQASSLIAEKLLRFDRPGHPHFSIATTRGRSLIAFILSEEADRLVDAGPM